MIDLNKQNNSNSNREQKTDDTPIGIVILGTIPFVILFWAVLTASFLHGIF